MSGKLFDKLSKEAQELFCRLLFDALSWSDEHLYVKDYTTAVVELDAAELIVVVRGRISFADDALDEVDKCLMEYIQGVQIQ